MSTSISIWLLNRLYERRWTVDQLVTARHVSDRTQITIPLRFLELSEEVVYDPKTQTYDLTRKTRVKISGRRKPTTKRTAEQSASVVNLEAERDRLILEFAGPNGLAEAAVSDDPVLHERLAHAIQDGMPAVDLLAVPKYRRPAAVEAALDEWRKIQTGGPCDFCGVRVQRPAATPIGYLDGEPSSGFTIRTSDNKTACAWCQDYLSSHTLDEARELLFNAMAGVVGLVAVGSWRHTPELVPFAHEVGYVGTPWGHLNAARRTDAQARAYLIVHRTRFVTSQAHAERNTVPGLPPVWWDIDAIPQHGGKFFSPLSDLRRAAEENKALEERRAKEAEQKAINARNKAASLARADAERARVAAAAEAELAQYGLGR